MNLTANVPAPACGIVDGRISMKEGHGYLYGSFLPLPVTCSLQGVRSPCKGQVPITTS